jgi:hypothetical protein
VLQDCDLVGGTQVIIPLAGLPQESPDSITTIIRIPKALTQGRSIMSVLHVSYLNSAQVGGLGGYSGLYAGNGNSYKESTELNTLMTGMMTAVDKIPITSTATVQLIAENVIMLKDGMHLNDGCFLRCIIANDENLANIHPRSYPAFSKLVEYAIKSYIYNSLVINVDMAELQGGYQLGAFKAILDTYSDAEQNYQDYLRDKWTKVALMNDQLSYRRLIKMTVGGNH